MDFILLNQGGNKLKREILCIPCGQYTERLFKLIKPIPGEHEKFVKGKASFEFVCDECGQQIEIGTEIYAVSIWSDNIGVPYFGWEHEYLNEE
jgi:hypothetical protein